MDTNAKHAELFDAGCEALASEIVLQAAKDYRKALRRKERPKGKTFEERQAHRMAAIARIQEVERFFRSQWFGILVDIDGETLIKKLNADHEAEQKRREALFAPIH
jgi:hypothetical protein